MTNRSFRLQPDIAARLAAEAEAQQRSANWIVNRALKEYLEHEEEERIRWQETLEAIEEVDKGNVYSAEEIFAWVDSWGSKNELPPPHRT